MRKQTNKVNLMADGLRSSCIVCWLAFLASLKFLPLAYAAGNPGKVTGLIYYAVENLNAKRVEQRGVAGSSGVAFDRINLGSNLRYRIWLLEAKTLRVADVEIVTSAPGRAMTLPDFYFRQASSHDSDGDQLHDLGEFIVGTDPNVRDSDGDGIEDGPEVKQGLDPLSGRAVRTGVIETVDTPGTAFDISALNDLAVVADRDQGISVFNVFNGMNAVLVAQVNTPGDAQAVSCSGNLVAVADGAEGLAVIDITDPPGAFIAHQIGFGANAIAVTTAAATAYVGLSDGRVVAVDLASGSILEQVRVASASIQDVTIGGDTLYILTVGKLFAAPIVESGLQIVAAVDSPGGQGAGRRRLRLFAGDRLLYATYTSGYNIFNIADPAQPALLKTVATPQFGWKQLVSNGSGIGLAALGANSTDDGAHDISVYNLGTDGTGGDFAVTFPTPGLAAAVSIYNGIAYVADSGAGLEVLNYLAYDSRGVPPTISLSTSFSAGSAEEGKLMRVTAHVTDDVQVRNVEFYINGVKTSTDGNYPFEYRFLTPLLREGRDSFTLRARASDTGGNATWSDELSIHLVKDATPPRVRRTVPFNGALVGAVSSVTAYFTEPIQSGTVSPANVRVVSGGLDARVGTADDVAVTGTLEYREELKSVLFVPSEKLGPGNYRLSISTSVLDLAGNGLSAPFNADFRVFSFTDNDQDGMPDELEAALGLDPTKPDTDGNGIVDGLEDPDRDGLPNAAEILAGTDPKKADTDGNGILDGAEDPDGDGLNNAREFFAGTNPLTADSDGDGWNDEVEISGGSDPLDPSSQPRPFVFAHPTLDATVISHTTGRFIAAGTVVAQPPLVAHVISLSAGTTFPPGAYVGRPPVDVLRLSTLPAETPSNTVVGRPPIDVRIGP